MGLFSSVGSLLNDITGITSSSNSAFSQQVQLNKMSYEQQKEFAQNAHQWEMDDLKKAGLNPALTAGGTSAGSIAGGGATSGSGSVGTSAGITPLSIVDAINSTRATSAQTKATEAQAEATPLNALANLMNAITNQNVGTSTIQLNKSQAGANDRGGLEQWLLGAKSPLKAIVKKAKDNIAQAEKETKKLPKKEKEIAEKFDKMWK